MKLLYFSNHSHWESRSGSFHYLISIYHPNSTSLELFIVFYFDVQSIIVGDASVELRNQLDISYPVNNGIVQNWEDMCHVWDHTFYEKLEAIRIKFLVNFWVD